MLPVGFDVAINGFQVIKRAVDVSLWVITTALIFFRIRSLGKQLGIERLPPLSCYCLDLELNKLRPSAHQTCRTPNQDAISGNN